MALLSMYPSLGGQGTWEPSTGSVSAQLCLESDVSQEKRQVMPWVSKAKENARCSFCSGDAETSSIYEKVIPDLPRKAQLSARLCSAEERQNHMPGPSDRAPVLRSAQEALHCLLLAL